MSGCHYTASRADPVSMTEMMASINWEIAKGYLRAAVAAHGNKSTGLETEQTKYYRLDKEVETFIKSVEDQELNM